jgi:hypothetical protein
MKAPDWLRQIGPALYGIGYHLTGDCYLVLFSNGSERVGNNAEKRWSFYIQEGQTRSSHLEERAKADRQFMDSVQLEKLGRDEIMSAQEKDLDSLLSRLRQLFAAFDKVE